MIPEFLILLLYIQNAFGNPLLSSEDESEKISVFNKCYEDIGCIETDSRWYDKKIRPVNVKPLDRHIIKTDFLLIKLNESCSKNLLYNSMMAKAQSIKDAGFNKKSEVIILVHDFTGNGYTGWIKHLSSVLLHHHADHNIISVDWQRGAEPPFDQAISNARIVSLEIITIIKQLKQNFEIFPEDIHIIGHGVGAHIAGYVGNVFNNLKKITALDPSGPRFAGMPNIVKLHSGTAKYVEVLHTDAFDSRSQGTKEELGHSDFFINDANIQPGCIENRTYPILVDIQRDNLIEGEILPGCSHKRAFKYYIEALFNDQCRFTGILCNSYEEFANGSCTSCSNNDKNNSCKSFGLRINSHIEHGSYFLSTADAEPYCLHQYAISVEVLSPGDHYGYFDFIFVDMDNRLSNASLNDPHSNVRLFQSGKENTYIYYSTPPKLGKLKEAKVRWNEKKEIYCIIYCKQTIVVRTIKVKSIQNDESVESSLCVGGAETTLDNGVYVTFLPCELKS